MTTPVRLVIVGAVILLGVWAVRAIPYDRCVYMATDYANEPVPFCGR